MGNKQLLFSVTRKDLVTTPFCASGPGGQHRNRNKTAIRLHHPASGATVEASDNKSQEQNKRSALKRLVEHPDFKLWHRLKAAELMGRPSIDDRVDSAMAAHNLKVEARGPDGKWMEISA